MRKIVIEKYTDGKLESFTEITEESGSLEAVRGYLQEVQNEIASGQRRGSLFSEKGNVVTTFRDSDATWNFIEVIRYDE